MLSNGATCTRYICKIKELVHTFSDKLCKGKPHSNYAWSKF